MARTKPIWWGEFKSADFARIDAEATIAVLPVAAIEQHGPHLPLSTDADIMAGMIGEAAARLPADLDVRFLPIQPVGKSNEHVYAPGTLSLSPANLVEAWTQIGASVAAAGVRKIVIVTSHGGNEEVTGIVARELRVAHAMLAARSSWGRFGHPDGLFDEAELRQGIHGGDVETSLMLHFRPELVEMKKARNFVSAFGKMEKRFDLLRPHGPHSFAWIASDLNPAGVVGNAAAATAEKGRLTAGHQADGFVRLLKDMRKAKLADLLS